MMRPGATVARRDPFVSIVIPTKNVVDTLPACLASIAAIDYPRDRYEVVVADGRSSDGTVQVASSAGARIVDDGGRGRRRVFGLNAALPTVNAPFVAFVDADCRVPKEWLRTAMRNLTDPSVGGVGGPVAADPDASLLARAIVSTMALIPTANVPTETRDVLHLAGCNAVFRTDVLRRVFPLPEATIEDVTLSKRVHELGFAQRHDPAMVVLHAPHYDGLGAFSRQMRLYGFGRRELENRHLGWRTWPGTLAYTSLLWMPVVTVADALGVWAGSSVVTAAVLLQLAAVLLVMTRALLRSRSWRIMLLSVPLLILGALSYSQGYLTAGRSAGAGLASPGS